MRIFHLYISGILYGRLRLDGGGPWFQKLDPATAELSAWGPLGEEDAAFYHAFAKIDLLAFARSLEAYERTLRGIGNFTVGTERYTSDDGRTYRQRDCKFPNNKQMEDGRLAAVICPAREMVAVLVEAGREGETPVRLWREAWPGEKIHPVAWAGNFAVPMRDGVRLSTDVYLPGDRAGKVPAVLVRTPYGREDGRESYYRYVQRGYAVVLQDVRGRNDSEGEWLPNYYETEDGDDTLNWIAAQDWCTGRVGMVGGSYLGFVQWAAAASGNPHLKALISVVCAGSPFVDMPRRGGTFSSGTLAWAFAVSDKTFRPERMERDDWPQVLDIRPLADLPRQALGYEVPFLTKWLEHRDYDDFWRRANWKERSCGARIPALIQSGWFDDNGMGTTEALELVHDFPRGMRKVVLGPWQHSGNSRYDLHGMSFGGAALRFDLDLLYFRWFEYHLKQIPNGIDRTPPVEYYTTGQERWKTAENWPLPDARPLDLYLDSGGSANTAGGDGRLLFERPGRQGCDSYLYDPRDPAVHIVDLSENELEVPEDYTQEEQRQDLLCYTTPPLAQDLVITGDMTAELYISSDAPDTDFILRVTEVDEAGRSRKLADGMLSARYRQGFERPVFLQAGEVACLKIRTTKISHCFRKGRRIRVTVTSGAKNLVFPHSNTRAGYDSLQTAVARNTVHHGGRYASRLTVQAEP